MTELKLTIDSFKRFGVRVGLYNAWFFIRNAIKMRFR